jgi:integrase
MSLILSMSKDLGTRPIELTWLKVKDVNLENGLVSITSAKYCNGRTLKLKSKTLDMLKQHIHKNALNQNDRIFPTKSENICDNYRRLRNKLAKKLQNPTLKQIRLYDFRHYFATMLYHKTKDLLHVKTALGHKDLRQTLRYTQLLETTEEDEFHCKVARTQQEMTELIEHGFTFVHEKDGLAYFKKRK